MSDTPSSPARAHPTKRLILGAVLICGAVLTAATALRGKSDPAWAQVHADFALLEAALTKYQAAHGSLPEEGSLDFLVPDYLPSVPVDPWGRPYLYSSNGAKPVLSSMGQDGLRGGFGAEQDHNTYDGHVR
jgi:general secretion pathway protein G